MRLKAFVDFFFQSLCVFVSLTSVYLKEFVVPVTLMQVPVPVSLFLGSITQVCLMGSKIPT
jgi:hypothetical protein